MIRVRQIIVDVDNDSIDELKRKIASKLKIKVSDIINLNINRKSLDARKKPKLYFVYEVDANLKNENKILRKRLKDVLQVPKNKYEFQVTGTEKLKHRIVIVGSGPSGLFCGYMLASSGYNPLIIERGERIEDRVKTVDSFWKTGNLNSESNVQFGEGGAGTFSDGKLNTLTKDPQSIMKKVFEIFVASGAPKEILYLNKPHIGTDILRNVVINMRNKIKEMGGEFRYNTKLTNIIISDNKITGIEVNNNEIIKTDNLVLAIGHSARDTFKMLYDHDINMLPKPFALGVRVIHKQELINKSQYGLEKHHCLLAANYKLTYQASNKRAVYSFCMCPGGYVVNSSSEKGRLVVNGMSNYDRDSGFANSAIVVSVSPDDYGLNPLDGVDFQKKLEEKAYKYSDGKIPVQYYRDFKNNEVNKIDNMNSAFKGDYKETNLNNILPDYVCMSLKEAIDAFDNKIKGFATSNPVLAAIESRTSSPVRIVRDNDFLSNIDGIYPCGEGAGYAGGITTSAIDGIKVAQALARKYRN